MGPDDGNPLSGEGPPGPQMLRWDAPEPLNVDKEAPKMYS